MLIGLLGKAGSGKDTAADILAKDCGFVKVSLADPLKRFCKEVFNFSNEQLWGPSEKRNEPDERYPRNVELTDLSKRILDGLKVTPEFLSRMSYLTPRYALQRLGTEWGRDCYPDVWVEYAVRVYEILQSGGVAYDQQRGLFMVSYVSDRADGWRGMRPKTDVVIPDVRFKNEVDGIRKAGGKVVRIVRPSQGLSGSAGLHASETEQDEIPTDALDHVIVNNGSLDDLVRIVKELYGDFLTASVPNEIDLGEELKMGDLLSKREADIKSGRLMAYDPEQEDVPPHLRKK